MTKKPKLGSGARFKKGVTNPAGLAAYIGRKKLGASRFNALSAKGK